MGLPESVPITSGTATIGGHDVASDSDAVRQLIGVIPQALTSDPDLTLEENLSIYAKLYAVPRAERKRSIDEVLEAVDLTKWRDAQVKTLLDAETPAVTIFGKSWYLHVEHVLRVSADENRRMIRDTVAFLKKRDREVLVTVTVILLLTVTGTRLLTVTQFGKARLVVLCSL